MLKRYLVFAGNTFYATGGWSEFVGSFDSVEEARDAAKIYEGEGGHHDWRDIVDIHAGRTVEFAGHSYGREMGGYEW
jgi:hypothetical protein